MSMMQLCEEGHGVQNLGGRGLYAGAGHAR